MKRMRRRVTTKRSPVIERAAVRVQVSLNMLNLGQAAIIAIGLTVIMLMAASSMAAGKMTIGSFVLINTYLMQLYQPLNFLGMVYMTIKQAWWTWSRCSP